MKLSAEKKRVIEDNFQNINTLIDKLWYGKFENVCYALKIDLDDFRSICLVILCENINKWDVSKSSLNTFIYMVLGNKLNSYIRNQHRDKRYPSIASVTLDDSDTYIEMRLPEVASAETVVVHNESDVLDKIISDYKTRLSAKQKRVFDMLLDGYSIQDILVHTGYTINEINNIRSTLSDDKYTHNLKMYMGVYGL